MDVKEFNNISKIIGSLNLPGDKSISHRALFFSAMAKGKSVIYNLSDGDDVLSTMNCLSALGVGFKNESNLLSIDGRGKYGLKKPEKILFAGNSGTTARLLTGVLSVQNFDSEISGDESLSKRPMKRVTVPLIDSGANIKLKDTGTLPVKIFPPLEFFPIQHNMQVASAQVKTSLILAGLHLEKESFIIENIQTRDHTERILNLKTHKTKNGIRINFSSANYPEVNKYFIPSDISSAAYFIVLALLLKHSQVKINNVSLNPTRTGFIELLKKMGANIFIERVDTVNNEPVGDLIAKSSELKNIEIPQDIIPNIIDEIPILTVAGIFADGEFKIDKISELRKKESDRISSICHNLSKLGLQVQQWDEGFSFTGRIANNIKPVFDSFNDHRIAMAFSICSLLLKQGGKVNNFSCVKISNPKFIQQLKELIR